ncbi:MAG: SsrA-binding protein SmpB [Lentisphaeria bacterium]|nr:SsrA-binding protein SmpB [Lentisphaerota bacterium]MBO5644625.1 SsrA-binding protein SmpB [Lentisphaeria bacterium]MBO5765412.1 SsrA-binding protein SmpB [Lentisphaeria bacterium]MBO5900254.1 SsrA-binding protein SmpB [Lentisphaeria bacterium]MBO5992275.1 SsrA-binding protein SmpB [Lentisphaeria bacterium]
MPRRTQDHDPVLASNRKALHDYNVIERYECGIELTGTEVKSCRSRAIQLSESFAKILRNQLWLLNCHISVCEFGGKFNHEIRRDRRLLMHKKEILKISQTLNLKGGTLIPLKFYLKNGLIKVELAYCQGKTHGDKRETVRERESDLAIRRAMKR